MLEGPRPFTIFQFSSVALKPTIHDLRYQNFSIG